LGPDSVGAGIPSPDKSLKLLVTNASPRPREDPAPQATNIKTMQALGLAA